MQRLVAARRRCYIAPATAPSSFDDAHTFWADRGVFSVADCFGVDDEAGRGELEAFFERLDPALAAQVANDNPKSKPRAAFDFAQQHSRPPAIDELWRAILARIADETSSGRK